MQALINTLIYRVIVYDDKIKILFHLKGGQKETLIMNLIFPDYPDSDITQPSSDNSNSISISFAKGAYTHIVVEIWGLEPHASCMPCKRSTK